MELQKAVRGPVNRRWRYVYNIYRPAGVFYWFQTALYPGLSRKEQKGESGGLVCLFLHRVVPSNWTWLLWVFWGPLPQSEYWLVSRHIRPASPSPFSVLFVWVFWWFSLHENNLAVSKDLSDCQYRMLLGTSTVPWEVPGSSIFLYWWTLPYLNRRGCLKQCVFLTDLVFIK